MCVEYIRKLTFKFICLFQFRFVTISPLKGRDTLSVFLLTIYVPTEVSGISLNDVYQVIDTQIVLLFTSTFISLHKDLNVDLSLLLPVIFAFACVKLLLRISFLIQGLSKGPKIPTF